MVYFIEDAVAQAIKIGVADDPQKRLLSLQTGNPRPLRLLGAIPGGFREEVLFHLKFRRDRIRGEWFRATEALRAEVLCSLHRYGDSTAETPFLSGLFDHEWCCDAVTIGRDPTYEELQRQTLRTSAELVGLPMTAAWVAPALTGRKDIAFQVMPPWWTLPEWVANPGFWEWHVDVNPQFFHSVGDALNACASAYRFWKDHLGAMGPSGAPS